ncbi:dehydrogenase/reductase SDR family member 7 isoform X2 [Photinus pyralis]|uniref:Dehydrogenase/reductase SDR family member 7 n=1 Tax=Photinus pyralis TaxID=7054 RepID=A0A1Y1N787_PHOPY|nr:dehydrogenase/reductase SDR family member 7 isoform X2 [Photinus pyralis]
MIAAIICIAIACYIIFYTITICLIDCDVELAFYEKFGKSIGHLKGKVVFITGASSGIGKHTALTLAKYGVKLVLAARRRNCLEEVRSQCITNSGGQLTVNDVLVLPMDMLDINSHQKQFDMALAHFGQIDILLNNAGRSQRAFWEMTHLTVDKELFELNVFSVVNLTRIAVNYFNSRGHGHVAVTSSLAGVVPIPYSGSYSGAKYAIHGYFNSLRIEKLRTNLKLAVTLLCPGPTYTEFLQHSFIEVPGKSYGISASTTDRRLTGERCGYLCAVALANETRESWMGIFPVLPFSYLSVYFPVITNWIVAIVTPQKMFKMRDGNEGIVTEGKKGN